MLAAAVVAAVAAGPAASVALIGAWGWVLSVPAVVALIKAGASTVRLWRRKAWRGSEVDRLGTTKVASIWTATTTGKVAGHDRPLAGRLLLNEGLVIRSQGRVLLAMGALHSAAIGSTASALSFRVVLGAVFLAASVAMFFVLHRRTTTAARFLGPDTPGSSPAASA